MAYIYAQDNYIIAFDDTNYFQLAKKDARFSENAESITVFEKGITGGEVVIPVADIGTWGTDTTMATFWALATLQVFLTKNTGNPTFERVNSGELAQALLVALTSTPVYTVPVGKKFKNKSITICNQSGAVRQFRMSIGIAGAVLAQPQYKYFDYSLPKDTTFEFDRKLHLNETDVIRFFSSGSGLSVTVNGVEKSI